MIFRKQITRQSILSTLMTSPKNTYFNSLTGFRFLAASLVFIFHNRKYWRHDMHPELLRFINEFHIGVALFFVLSGFLITYSYFDEPLQSVKNYSRYMLLRIVRIMPVYWIILTAFYLDPAYGKYHFRFDTYTLVHAFSNKTNLYGIAQAWSLNVEMTFYLLAPLLCFALRKNLMYILIGLAFLFGGSVMVGQLWHQLNGNPTQYFYPIEFVVNSTFAGRSVQFLAGMLLAQLLRNNRHDLLNRFTQKTLSGFVLIIVTTYVIGLFQKNIYVCGTDTAAGMLLHTFILPIGIVLAIAGLMTEKTWLQRIFASRLFVLLGNASFAFYLVHISYVNLKICKLILLPDRNFILLWVVSVLIYLLIEKPVYDRLRRWITGKPNSALLNLVSGQ